MFRRVLILITVLALIGIPACSLTSKITKTSEPATPQIIKEAKIGSDWEMKQLKITLEKEISILLKLTDGDEVDGYFYLEKGDNIDFSIAGKSLFYESEVEDTKASREITSDRFSFVASKSQGIAYTLTLSNPAADSDSSDQADEAVIVFLEIIYPATGSVFIPVTSK